MDKSLIIWKSLTSFELTISRLIVVFTVDGLQ